MSDQIRIEGIYGFGRHGVFGHERENGQGFLVDITLRLDLSKASRSDLVEDTIDYASVCDLVVAQIIGSPVALIEKLAGQIVDLLLDSFSTLDSVSVTVHKPMAPVSVDVKDIAVTIERSR